MDLGRVREISSGGVNIFKIHSMKSLKNKIFAKESIFTKKKTLCFQVSLHSSWTFSIYIIHCSATPSPAYPTSRIQSRYLTLTCSSLQFSIKVLA